MQFKTFLSFRRKISLGAVHISVSPANGNGPTQGQRKTLTRVGIEPTTFGLTFAKSLTL